MLAVYVEQFQNKTAAQSSNLLEVLTCMPVGFSDDYTAYKVSPCILSIKFPLNSLHIESVLSVEVSILRDMLIT